jgi:Dimethyladenosine transferase (rRNA methylation)
MIRNNQIFIKNEKVIERIIDAAELNDKDVVLEIGSGDGRMTGHIAKKAKKVYAVEKDLYLLDESKMNLVDIKNIDFINADILKMDIPNDVNKIVSNLPYNISSPITEKLIYFMNNVRGSLAVLMYQKEFGDRMVAFPGLRDYSMLSVFVQYCMNVEKVMDVSKANFRPVPAVDSIVIKMRPKEIKIDDDFLAFCRVIFQHKKKTFILL